MIPQMEKGPVQERIEKKLREAFLPTAEEVRSDDAPNHQVSCETPPLHYLEVINESSRHCVPAGSETHFKVIIVSNRFEGVPLLERHRMVNQILDDEFQAQGGTVHALSIVAKTEKQWTNVGGRGAVEASPACMKGDALAKLRT